MLARLLSLYQLVLAVFVYLYLALCVSNFYLHENLYQMFSLVLSVLVYISLDPKIFWTLFLLLSPKLFSLFVYFWPSISFPSFFITLKCQIYCQCPLLLRHACNVTFACQSIASTSNYLSLCCWWICNRQTMVLLSLHTTNECIIFCLIKLKKLNVTSLWLC